MEAIGQLAGGIAHDFNNVLTAILGYGTLMEQALGPGSPLHEDLGEIRRAAERAAARTAQLLAFSRRQIISPRVLDLGDTIRSLEPMLRRLLGEDIDLVVRVRPEGGRVKADPGQIQQVLLNLSVNARDAMPEGGTLLFEVADADLDDAYARQHIDVPAGRYLLLMVSDTGIGMDASTAARVFEPFFTTKPAGKGTGLGLSTVHGIVKQSGGSVMVYSEPGHGSSRTGTVSSRRRRQKWPSKSPARQVP